MNSLKNVFASFVGRYCLQTSCDLHPCQNGGLCSLTSDGYLCSCPQGFGGPQCERRLMPCETEPCVNGICIEDKTRKDGYRCQCHLWWIGTTRRLPILVYISQSKRNSSKENEKSCIMRFPLCFRKLLYLIIKDVSTYLTSADRKEATMRTNIPSYIFMNVTIALQKNGHAMMDKLAFLAILHHLKCSLIL